jgi:hypothetical protein
MKISGGFRCQDGTADFATIRSFISTSKKHGWNVIHALTQNPQILSALSATHNPPIPSWAVTLIFGNVRRALGAAGAAHRLCGAGCDRGGGQPRKTHGRGAGAAIRTLCFRQCDRTSPMTPEILLVKSRANCAGVSHLSVFMCLMSK